MENSKSYQEIEAYVSEKVKTELKTTHAREMQLQQARLQRKIDARLQKLPEYRRQYAEQAMAKILKRFYGESEDRIETIADVALDAMEHDAYWVVFEQIGNASHGDVGTFAKSLEQFGLLEIAVVGVQAARRREFLDYFEKLALNDATLEQDMHVAFENNLWMLGRNYSTMASNSSLNKIVNQYCDAKFKGPRASKRPDLLLSQDYGDSYLLIEFKRPSDFINRDHLAQAEKYRDDLSPKISASHKMEIIMIGKGKASSIDANNLSPNIKIHSYLSIISSARTEIDWIIKSLKSQT